LHDSFDRLKLTFECIIPGGAVNGVFLLARQKRNADMDFGGVPGDRLTQFRAAD
jgi:hypothetical protein